MFKLFDPNENLEGDWCIWKIVLAFIALEIVVALLIYNYWL